MKDLSFDSFTRFIIRERLLDDDYIATKDTLVEDDLGITGDDGAELLEALEKEYQIEFEDGTGSLRKAFGMREDEYLFHSEGFCIFDFWRNRKKENVIKLTLGKLYDVVVMLSENRDKSEIQ